MAALSFVLPAALLLQYAAAGLPAGAHPVVIVGPLLGQDLEVKNDRFSVCNTGGKWRWEWVNLEYLKTPSNVYCTMMDLETGGFDNATGLTKPQAGVEVRHRVPPGIAGTSLYSVLEARLEQAGFVLGTTMAEHNYDWRLSVAHWSMTSFPDLQHLVETLSRNASGAPVVLTGVSMAGPYAHAFISWVRGVDAAWPGKYLHVFAPIDGPWNGAADALLSLVSSSLGSFLSSGACPRCMPVRLPNVTQPAASFWSRMLASLQAAGMGVVDDILNDNVWGWPSIYWISSGYDASTTPGTDVDAVEMVNGEMAPECVVDPALAVACGANATHEGDSFSDPSFLGQHQCAECYRQYLFDDPCKAGYEMAFDGWTYNLCCKKHQCNAMTYKASQLPLLFERVGRTGSADMMRHAQSHGTTADPGVPVHCIYSSNSQTIAAPLKFATRDALGTTAYVVFDDGDGTVDLPSLEICSHWASTVKTYRFTDLHHAGSLSTQQLADIIEALALNKDDVWKAWKTPTREELIANNASVVAPDALFVAPAAQLFV